MSPESQRPLVIAHRGVHGPNLPENTLKAFEAALAAGAEMIECDVRRTADGQLVIFHDPTIRRDALDAVTHAQLCEGSAIEVPLLEDVLDWARGKIALDVELKEDGYVDRVAKLLEAFEAGGGELFVTSFNDPVIAQLPQFHTGLLLSFTSMGAGTRARQCGADALVPQMKVMSPAVFSDAEEHGLEVYVWDFMATKHGELLADARLAGAITDDVPGALKARAAASSAV